MPLPIPNLDNRRYNELIAVLRDRIPKINSAWTDFNPSDPGIAIVEMWCWLAEQILYRMNQITPRSNENFLKLILDPPEPVTAEVTLEINPPLTPSTPSQETITIPAGIRFQTVELPLSHPLLTGTRLVFETFESRVVPFALEAVVAGDPPVLQLSNVSFPVRSKVVVANEQLGVSTGEPNQIFTFKHGPVLVDPNHVSTDPAAYNPNPWLTVDGVPWQFVPDFLDAATDETATHFMVEPFTNRVRFGNNIKGAIPPAGAVIHATSYQVILGKEVKIAADTLPLDQVLDAIADIPAAQMSAINNTPAEGGAFLYTPEEMQTRGLQFFKEKFRAITAEDFAEMATVQFNRAQESDFIAATPNNRVARAIAVPGRNLQEAPPEDEASAVSVLILPRVENPADIPVVSGTDFDNLKAQVHRFLDRRRLITTRLYVVEPDYVSVDLQIRVSIEPLVNFDSVRLQITERIKKFFHPLTGGEGGAGWPLGRTIYKSEIFQLAESVQGVDHINSITINSDSSLTAFALTEKELPRIEDSNISVS